MRNVVFQALAEAARNGEPVALAIISEVTGSSPQKAGCIAVFHSDDRLVGTIGGGCLEAEVQRRAIHCLRTGVPETFELVLDHDFGWDDGLICGGKVTGVILPNAQSAGEAFWSRLGEGKADLKWGVTEDYRVLEANPGDGRSWRYSETVFAPCGLWIAGAGHIARAVAPLANQLGFAVSVFDDRPAMANPRFFPQGVDLHSEIWEQMLQRPLPATPTFGLIVTRGHRHDALVLREWIHKGFSFLGMIGSERKARLIFEQFESEKLATRAELERIACPVGVKIRSRTVDEIAVSIMAQYIDKRAELVYAKRENHGAH